MMRVLDLFSGIGGFSLGLERAGMTTVAFCEIDPYCRAVLRKHWPDVPCYDDVRTLTARRLAADGISVDVICGGFPCQDISCAGAGAGIEGERSGLWREYSRLIGELRPGYVIVENVAALLGRGLGVVLGDLAALGFDAEWHCIPASAVGAPHRRDRVWIVAYPNSQWLRGDGRTGATCSTGSHEETPSEWERLRADIAANGGRSDVADTNGSRAAQSARRQRERGLGSVVSSKDVGHSRRGRRSRSQGGEVEQPGRTETLRASQTMPHPNASDEYGRGSPLQMGWGRFAREIADNGDIGRTQWGAEPDVGRVAHGVPSRVDRLGALGNAVVPQIPEIIGRAILAAQLHNPIPETFDLFGEVA